MSDRQGERAVSVSGPQWSNVAGGCNGCTFHAADSGTGRHVVFEIELRCCSVRVCRECLLVLIEKLKARK